MNTYTYNNFKISIDPLFSKNTDVDKKIYKYGLLFAKDKYDIGTLMGYEAHIVDKYCSK